MRMHHSFVWNSTFLHVNTSDNTIVCIRILFRNLNNGTDFAKQPEKYTDASFYCSAVSLSSFIYTENQLRKFTFRRNKPKPPPPKFFFYKICDRHRNTNDSRHRVSYKTLSLLYVTWFSYLQYMLPTSWCSSHNTNSSRNLEFSRLIYI